MKKILFVALLCASTAALSLATATEAFALNSTGGASASGAPSGGAPGGAPGGGQGSQGGGHEQKFEERKAEIEKRIENHIAEAQARLSCVRAASNHEALKACLPERHGGGHGGFGGGHGGEGGQHEGAGEPGGQ